VSIDDFLDLISSENPARTLPFRLLNEFDVSSFDDAGQAVGSGWDQIEAPGSDHADAFAIGITGDAYAPIYRDGAVLIASASAPRRRGDRIALFGLDGTFSLAELGHETARQLQLRGLDGSEMPPKKASDLRLVARILWVSQ
jgi:phage repressor protein C with HTH and peptisase S24 domain